VKIYGIKSVKNGAETVLKGCTGNEREITDKVASHSAK
jgi:hypothetical protein